MGTVVVMILLLQACAMVFSFTLAKSSRVLCTIVYAVKSGRRGYKDEA